MLITDKRYNIGKAQIEGAVVQTLKDWATAFPHELVAFDQQMKLERQNLHRENGIARSGNMRRVAEIPVKLNALMCRRFDKDWFFDIGLREMVLNHFKVGVLAKGGRTQRA